MLENLRKMIENVRNMPQRCYNYRCCEDVDVVAKMLQQSYNFLETGKILYIYEDITNFVKMLENVAMM
jgi:hypothetical protein